MKFDDLKLRQSRSSAARVRGEDSSFTGDARHKWTCQIVFPPDGSRVTDAALLPQHTESIARRAHVPGSSQRPVVLLYFGERRRVSGGASCAAAACVADRKKPPLKSPFKRVTEEPPQPISARLVPAE